MPENEFNGWAILELMGHRRLGGMVEQVEFAGAAMVRIDVYLPGKDTPEMTQLYGGSAIYCLTPTTEEIARGIAARNCPQPVTRYELPAPEPEREYHIALGRDGLDRAEDDEGDDYETDQDAEDILRESAAIDSHPGF